ncbi:MAG: carboxypeptidase-like regulatory domain-containing protein [Bacteroidia bacterium]|nr:carboxypeptidase-like regulatory domain-containing protein [Bacteroidia bacterium]
MSKICKTLLFGLILTITVSSCVKEEFFEEQTTTIIPQPQEIITTSVIGRVLDKNDQPITGALVQLKTSLTIENITTDDDGYFSFENIENKGPSAFLSIQSDGKFEAFRRLSVLEDRNNYTEIKMQDKSIIGTVEAANGGRLSNSDGAEIELPANGIIDGSGNAYTGFVNVAMAWIDPSAADLASQVVGDLSAIDAEGNVRSLATYGMLQIELLDGAGNELNIADGQQATLQFPVPQELINNAPSTIPLWSYEEEIGTWIEEGSATLQGGFYIGNVSHFSSWNVDFMYDPISITGKVEFTIEGTEVGGGYLSVYVTSDLIGKKGGWLCDDGSFLFYNFPKGEQFQLQIFDHCGNLKYEETYGPYDSDQNLGTIVVQSSTNLVKITGNALNCDGSPVSDGYVTVELEDRYQSFKVEEDGTFEFAVDVCEEDDDVEMTIVDLTTFLKAELEFDSSIDAHEFVDVELCDELTDFFSISIDGADPIVVSPGIEFRMVESDTGSVDLIYLEYEKQDSTFGFIAFGLKFQIPDPMMLPATLDAIHFYFQTNQGYYFQQEVGDLVVTITEYDDEDDGFIGGTFTGTIKTDNTGGTSTAIPVSGEFRVPID